MRIGGRVDRGRGNVQAASREFQHCVDLLSGDVEFLHYIFDSQTSLQVFEHVATGIRVPLNTQAPLTFPGTLSTAGHFDQSSVAIYKSLTYQHTLREAVSPGHLRGIQLARQQPHANLTRNAMLVAQAFRSLLSGLETTWLHLHRCSMA